MCCSTHPKTFGPPCCARIQNVTWVQLCSRLQQDAKRRVDQHPAVTAVPEKPRTPIASSCLSHRMTCSCLRASNSFESIIYDKSQQSYSCLRAVQFCTRLTGPHAASWSRGHFAIHVRVSSNCTYTYRSRWGRATCLSDWAQGLNMERLRAQAPCEAISKPREPHVRQQGGGARVVCDPGH